MHLSNRRILIISIVIMSILGGLCCLLAYDQNKKNNESVRTSQSVTFGRPPIMIVIEPVEDDIVIEEIEEPEAETSQNDILEDDVKLLAQLIRAEAGNQDLRGKRLVADVVLNRVESDLFPNTIEEVIFQGNPTQFAVTKNGAFERAAETVDESDYEAARLELSGDRIDTGILYFATGKWNGTGFWKYGDHWFSYQ